MIQVSSELKNAVITEQKPKNMSVTITQTDNLKLLNWYATEYHGSNWYNLDISPGSYTTLLNLFKFDVDGAINYDYANQAEWVGVSFDLLISDIDPDSYESFRVRLLENRDGVSESTTSGTNLLSDYATAKRWGMRVNADGFEKFTHFRIVNSSTNKNLKAKFTFTNVKIYMYAGDSVNVINYSDIFATETNVARYIALGTYGNANIISQSFAYTESICSEDRLKLGLAESSAIELSLLDTVKIPVGCDIDVSLHIADVEDGFEWNNFVVAESTKRSSGGIGVCDLTCYDRNSKLSQNAYSWYTKYMWGMNLDSPQPNEQYKFDYCRQAYGTLRNLLNTFQVEKNVMYNPESYSRIDYVPEDYPTQERYFDITNDTSVTDRRILFSKYTVTHESGLDVVDVFATTQVAYGRWDLIDKFYRGVSTNANIYIDIHLPEETIRVLGNSGDLIAIPPECETFDVYVPYSFGNTSFTPSANGQWISSIKITQRKHDYYDVDNIVNGYRQLPYFSYKENVTVDDIVKVDSNITVRDIVRSICEMCGCFFRLDRNGNPTFIYASEHGMYPENTLYPADTLFPQKSGEMTMPTSYYIKAEFAEYQVSNYGGVQVIVNTSGNTGGVCRIEYWTDEDNDNAYVMDDNIFLCADGLVLEDTTDLMTILENMYGCLDNLQYTPFEAETIGTPFLESGDRFTLLTKNDGFESFIFERKLKGIQALRDYFSARGIQKTPRVKNFEWNS